MRPSASIAVLVVLVVVSGTTASLAQFEQRPGDKVTRNPDGSVDILRVDGVLARAEEELGPVFYDRRKRGYYIGRAGDRYEMISCRDDANRSARTCRFYRWRPSAVTVH